ncbi:MAG: bifunctional [glutamate--ammonia ligase]-adenylyl-L-tyrosine phosphorylase/[glutamate--ammonia-ligase] adenylyltransferase, partial [Neisseriaceae bacterium]
YREEVNTLFESIFYETDVKSKISQASLNFAWENPARTFKTLQRLERYGCVEPGDILFQLQEFKENISYDKLDTRIQTSFDQLVPHYLEVIFELGLGKLALGRILEFSKSIMERPSYLIFLNEYPMVIRQLIVLLSKSQWLANYLTKYPMLLDELISEQLWDRNFDWSHLKKQLDEQLEELSDDVEQQMDRLRKFQHGFFFRLAVQELEGLWTVEALSDQLAALADAILEVALKQVWRNYRKAHKEVPQFAIIAYGKLGGKELTYTSDLDLVYLYSDNYPEAIDIYSWFSSRLTLFLSAATGSGRLYEVDLRLRPYGEVGFLATDFDLFQNYQYEKAWTWEHQALTRARFVCGSRHLKIKFEQLRKKILVSHRDPAQLKQQIIEMRNKMLNSHPSRDLLDVKHTRGGLADVEFIIQYIVLAYSARYPDLTENVGNIALLQRSAQYGIIEESLAEKVRWAYRHYRKIAHNQILHDIPPQIDLEALKIDYNYVKTLWHKVLET